MTGLRHDMEGIRWVSARHAGQLMDAMLVLWGCRYPDRNEKARLRGPVWWGMQCQPTAAVPYFLSKKAFTCLLTLSWSGWRVFL